MNRRRGSLLVLVALLGAGGCWSLRGSSGGGEVPPVGARRLVAADVALATDYRIEPVASGLDFPVAVAFDDRGGVYVLEAGYSYGEVFATPRIVRIEVDGMKTPVISGANPPWNGMTFHDGAFYVAVGGEQRGGALLRVGLDGRSQPILEGLPSLGDHHTNGPALGPDGWLYFGQGTATNSGVVGPDNAEFGWLTRHPEFHDTPCEDLTLAGENFESDDVRPPGPPKKVRTGAFSPYGSPTRPNQVIPGKLPCNGAVMRVRPEGGGLALVAWGLRNPFGLAFAPDGALYVTENGYDLRGSRPIFGAGDYMWRIEPGRWYGWPDYAGGEPVSSGLYSPPGEPAPKPLLATKPGDPPRPAAILAAHSSSNGFDFSRSEVFGHVGQAFVAQFGDLSPTSGKVVSPVGFKVVRVDVSSGLTEDFAVNRARDNGPASKLGTGGLERPVAARFNPAGDALYVVDFGVVRVTEGGPAPVRRSGVLWRIARSRLGEGTP